ncbi:N-terminal nucleophile aminohydrolase [Xylariaceae sp. FL0662B]|nr:N-terminal nucleophile aminohydrolase [Xylariaceae sp. FL0662B]
MEYRRPSSGLSIKPRLIIHGGAGNITPEKLGADKYARYREALLMIVSRTNSYMNSPQPQPPSPSPSSSPQSHSQHRHYPNALASATHAVVQLENNGLFNSGHGAVFTRDGTNELEASVMVSRGRAKRGVGVTGLRRVKNPVLLARAMLEHGDVDLVPKGQKGEGEGEASSSGAGLLLLPGGGDAGAGAQQQLDVPSAQGHTLVHGSTAEALARKYGLEIVEPAWFFTRQRWEEHVRALEREREGSGLATWSAEEYLPQGTCGAVALDADGVVCAATSTGGLTNKLTGRIGDTPVVGAGFWAEEWAEDGNSRRARVGPPEDAFQSMRRYLSLSGPAVELSANLRIFLADCLPTPFVYSPINRQNNGDLRTTRSIAMSGTGNGDSFLRVAAVRSAAAIARWGGLSGADALYQMAGRGGELQRSAGDRWGKTGEGEGGMIGIECVVSRDESGRVVEARSEILQEHNCAGMFRAWIDDDGKAMMRIWHPEEKRRRAETFEDEDRAEDVWRWSEKA